MSLAVPFSADADEPEDAIMLPVPEGDMWPLLLLASVLLLLILLLLLGSLLEPCFKLKVLIKVLKSMQNVKTLLHTFRQFKGVSKCAVKKQHL